MSKTAKAKYRTPEHRRARANLKREVDSGNGWCVQPVCLYTSREIPPGASWDVAHDDAGLVVIGAAHATCNRSDGATRGNRMRGVVRTSRRWVL